MKYAGPERYKYHVLGDAALALDALRKAGFTAKAMPHTITVQDTTGQRKINGTWCTKYGGAWGQAWHFYRGRGRSRVEMVKGPDGHDNPAWRHNLRHEVMHALMAVNGIAVGNYDAQHRLMKTKLKGWF